MTKGDTVTLVLLGRRGSGKSCCGKTILGRKGFKSFLSTKPVTTKCEKQTESIQGRQVTVIDTPDFFDDSLPDPTPHIDTCRSLAEGPCVYLLVLQLGRFTEGEKEIVEQTERLFGQDVTRRMIILFSYGDDLEGITIEDFLKNAQTELKALVEKCGNRYHVFNNRVTSNHRQVTELLNTVDVMLGRGEGGPVSQKTQLSVKNTRYVENQEAPERNNDSAVRRMAIQVNDSTYRVKRKAGMTEGDDGSLEKRDTIAVTLMLLGRRGSGKSCCGNTILGRNGFQSVLSSKPVTIDCKEQTESIQGRQITVIDTPDFFDDSFPHPKYHINRCMSLAEDPCVYLLVLQLGRFTEGEKKIVEQTERVFGPDVTRRMIILFSYGDDLEGITIEDFLKNAQTELKALLMKCGNRYHVFNNRDTSNHRQVTELLNTVDDMLGRGKGDTELTDSVNGVERKVGMAEGDNRNPKMPRISTDINESNAGNVKNKLMNITGNQKILKTQINGDYSGNAGSMRGDILYKRGDLDIQRTSVNVRDSRMGKDGGVPESQRENACVSDNRHRVKKKPEMMGDYDAQGTASALGTTQGHSVRDPDTIRTDITDSANTSYGKRRAGESRESSSEMQREDCRRVDSRDTFKSIYLEMNQHDVYKKKNMRGAPGDPQQERHKQKHWADSRHEGWRLGDRQSNQTAEGSHTAATEAQGVVRDGRKMQAQGSPVTRGKDNNAQRDGRKDKESTPMCKCVLL